MSPGGRTGYSSAFCGSTALPPRGWSEAARYGLRHGGDWGFDLINEGELDDGETWGTDPFWEESDSSGVGHSDEENDIKLPYREAGSHIVPMSYINPYKRRAPHTVKRKKAGLGFGKASKSRLTKILIIAIVVSTVLLLPSLWLISLNSMSALVVKNRGSSERVDAREEIEKLADVLNGSVLLPSGREEKQNISRNFNLNVEPPIGLVIEPTLDIKKRETVTIDGSKPFKKEVFGEINGTSYPSLNSDEFFDSVEETEHNLRKRSISGTIYRAYSAEESLLLPSCVQAYSFRPTTDSYGRVFDDYASRIFGHNDFTISKANTPFNLCGQEIRLNYFSGWSTASYGGHSFTELHQQEMFGTVSLITRVENNRGVAEISATGYSHEYEIGSAERAGYNLVVQFKPKDPYYYKEHLIAVYPMDNAYEDVNLLNRVPILNFQVGIIADPPDDEFAAYGAKALYSFNGEPLVPIDVYEHRGYVTSSGRYMKTSLNLMAVDITRAENTAGRSLGKRSIRSEGNDTDILTRDISHKRSKRFIGIIIGAIALNRANAVAETLVQSVDNLNAKLDNLRESVKLQFEKEGIANRGTIQFIGNFFAGKISTISIIQSVINAVTRFRISLTEDKMILYEQRLAVLMQAKNEELNGEISETTTSVHIMGGNVDDIREESDENKNKIVEIISENELVKDHIESLPVHMRAEFESKLAAKASSLEINMLNNSGNMQELVQFLADETQHDFDTISTSFSNVTDELEGLFNRNQEINSRLSILSDHTDKIEKNLLANITDVGDREKILDHAINSFNLTEKEIWLERIDGNIHVLTDGEQRIEFELSQAYERLTVVEEKAHMNFPITIRHLYHPTEFDELFDDVTKTVDETVVNGQCKSDVVYRMGGVEILIEGPNEFTYGHIQYVPCSEVMFPICVSTLSCYSYDPTKNKIVRFKPSDMNQKTDALAVLSNEIENKFKVIREKGAEMTREANAEVDVKIKAAEDERIELNKFNVRAALAENSKFSFAGFDFGFGGIGISLGGGMMVFLAIAGFICIGGGCSVHKLFKLSINPKLKIIAFLGLGASVVGLCLVMFTYIVSLTNQ